VPDITGGVLPTAQALLPSAAAFLTQAAGGPATPGAPGPQATVVGVVTAVDPVALTFTLRAADGKTCVFVVSAKSRVGLAALADNLFTQQQVTVTYQGTRPLRCGRRPLRTERGVRQAALDGGGVSPDSALGAYL
jgi:hypothetical protein